MDIGIGISIVSPSIVNGDPDTSVSNFELESGDDLLLESGAFLLLE